MPERASKHNQSQIQHSASRADVSLPQWRTLDELRSKWGDPTIHDEFAPGVIDEPTEISRRQFLNLMAASIALASAHGCTRQPPESIVPYVEQPERILPGLPLSFATAHVHQGYGLGVLVQSREGRPIKVEGNPDHSASLGGTDVFAQATLLTLYDPDRSQAVTERGIVSIWTAFVNAITARLDQLAQRGGAGLALLTGNFTSPTLLEQMQSLLARYPQANWFVHDPSAAEPYMPSEVGADWHVVLHLERAQVILSLDSNFLQDEPGSVRYALDFINGRRVRDGQTQMNRLYTAEPMPTVTGSSGDHRLALRASEIELLARVLAAELDLGIELSEREQQLLARHRSWIEAVAADLRVHRGAGLVIAGRGQPPRVHQLARAINDALGNTGVTIEYRQMFDAASMPQSRPLAELVAEIDAGRIDTLIIIEANPAYTAPADFEFARRLEKVPFRMHHGLYFNETARLCDWHLPSTHELESWSDVRAYDGTVTIIQPLIAPMYDSRTAHELISILAGEPNLSGYDIVRRHWRGQVDESAFEQWWRRALHAGVVPRTDGSPGAPMTSQVAPIDATNIAPAPPRPGGWEIVFKPDPRVWDGAYANNAWLQELPKPITKLTWDNAALMSPATAAELAIVEGDMIELRYRGRTLELPALIVPGHADGSVTVHLGYGRWKVGRIGEGVGFNAYALRTSEQPWFDEGLEIRRLDREYALAITQGHQRLAGRQVLRTGSVDAFREAPQSMLGDAHHEPNVSLYRPHQFPEYMWAMNIDLTACIGCGTCTIACQAENNIPVVGKAEVLRQREMHWIRVDTYFEGPPESPGIYHIPIPCMHCENAPCEPVCPVAATLHTADGLNAMIYNRCVGTRYCSNNCPYKVRRFNFFGYAFNESPTIALARNPEVTVRSRGVMEKCTYCIQRIAQARIQARLEHRRIGGDEVVPACAQACPTRAIVFGDGNNPSSAVYKLRNQPHAYSMLAHLNTRPRTNYLVRILNPNAAAEIT